MKSKLLRLIESLLVVLSITGFIPACGPSSPYQIAPLTVTPLKAGSGRPVKIETTVTNTATTAGNLTASLKVNDKPVNSLEIVLSAGEKIPIAFNYTAKIPGNYKLDLNGISANLEVVKPADFQVVSLDVITAQIVSGKQFTARAKIKNLSDVEGLFSAKLTSEGKELTTKEVSINGNVTQEVTMNTTFDTPGSHTLEFGGVRNTLTVLKPAELRATGINITPSTIFPGQKAIVEASLINAPCRPPG
jgi:hypothetical protein